MKLQTKHFFAKLLAVPCVIGIVGSAISASAATINYGDFTGATVDYINVREDANSVDDVPPLFGAPTVTGDSIDFDPVGFNAAAGGASGIDITDGNLAFDIVAKPNYAINNVRFTEAGDTTLAGFGTDATFTSATARIFVDIKEVDGAGISEINYQTSMTFSPDNGTYRLGTEGGGGPLFQTIWNGLIDIDVDQILTDNGISFTSGATLVSINLDNTLVASSQDGTTSFIAKKDADGVTITTNLPEPSSMLLALLGAAGLGMIRRR
ncbi:MAG: hypothetical protein KDA92_00245 [Planctomycetales bacterium]|nr:hypothetical protein [Planctomycetales bacterium]MCA9166876.1 hypothetical protein [Planctomycetales bacterium]